MTNHTERRRSLRHAALALAGVSLALCGLSACGTDRTEPTHAAAAAPRATATTPPPTANPAQSALHMISNKGHKLAFYVTPGRLPAIVLDAGGGLDASYWNKVAQALAKGTGSEVIAYDRSGEGRSDAVPGPWKAQYAADDLAAGLTQLGITKDVLLVSHSLAGEIATAFVQQHPQATAGAVLVDANLPPFFTDSETARLVAANAPQIASLRKAPQTRATRQLLAEAEDYGLVHRAYHALSWPQNIPATAIVSAQTPFPTPTDAQLWRQAQQEFVAAAPNRRLVTAEHSSHNVPVDRPDVVISAVQDMVNQVR